MAATRTKKPAKPMTAERHSPATVADQNSKAVERIPSVAVIIWFTDKFVQRKFRSICVLSVKRRETSVKGARDSRTLKNKRLGAV